MSDETPVFSSKQASHTMEAILKSVKNSCSVSTEYNNHEKQNYGISIDATGGSSWFVFASFF